MTEILPRLIGDIGGTNVRFALAMPDGTITHEHKLPVADFPGIEQAAQAFLTEYCQGGAHVREAVFAVATPVQGDTIAFTNNPWRFSVREAEATLGLDRLDVINDFVAQAASIRMMSADDMGVIKPGKAAPDKPAVVIGPGTGLGIAFILRRPEGEEIMGSEGGHCTFAARDETQAYIRDVLAKQHGHVSTERLLSGPGLLSIALALAARAGTSLRLENPADVSRLAGEERCPVCLEAIRVFSAVLGSVAGDAVLMTLSMGGVYLMGGLSRTIRDLLDMEALTEAFLEKGRFRALLQDVQVQQVLRSHTGLLGAAAYRGGVRG